MFFARGPQSVHVHTYVHACIDWLTKACFFFSPVNYSGSAGINACDCTFGTVSTDQAPESLAAS